MTGTSNPRHLAWLLLIGAALTLTLGGGAGHTLVGLTLHPGRPGRNQVFIYLVPPSGEGSAQGIRAGLSLAGVATR